MSDFVAEISCCVERRCSLETCRRMRLASCFYIQAFASYSAISSVPLIFQYSKIADQGPTSCSSITRSACRWGRRKPRVGFIAGLDYCASTAFAVHSEGRHPFLHPAVLDLPAPCTLVSWQNSPSLPITCSLYSLDQDCWD